jgi:2-haloacid dehalogenase
MARVSAAVFDAYGTIFDVHAAMSRHAERLGPDWRAISQEWRDKQMEYTWVRSLVGPQAHRDFAQATRDALDYVAARHGIADAALLDDLTQAYRRLDAYPEVPAALARLKDMGIECAILSNGEPSMLEDAVEEAGIGRLLIDVLSVESVGVFKPDPRVYRLATERLGAEPQEMAFVSSNAWDVFGAREFGFQAHRVNRQGLPDEYGLRGTVPEVSDLGALADLLA